MKVIKEQLRKVWINFKERGFKEAYNFAFYRYFFSVHNHFVAGLINRLAPYPPYIEVEISTYCNLKCLMCEHTYWKHPSKNMTYEQFLHIMNSFPKLKWIDITGIGEGFMNKDYLKMIEYIKSKHIYLELYDPFFFWDREMSYKMVTLGLNHIQPSFDAATEKTYNLIRKGSDFNRVVKNLRDLFIVKKELNKKLPEVSFHYIVSKQNIDEMLLYLELVKDIANGDRISVTFTKVLCGFEEIKEQVVDIPDSLMNDAVKKGVDLGIKVKWNRNVHQSNRPDYSHTLWTMPFIFVTGDVIPCCGGNERNQRDFQIENSLGNIFKEDFRKIWKNEKYTLLRKTLRENKIPIQCPNCPTFGNKQQVC